jgi:hypothetical protein
MRFIKENPALAAGIGLPVLLVILFSVAAAIPKWTVAPPEYDLLFTTNQYDRNSDVEVRFQVVDGHIKAQQRKVDKNNSYNNNLPHLYRYNVKSNNIREIAVSTNLPGDSQGWQELPVPEVDSLKIDSNIKAPDGYEFRNEYGYYRGDMFLFPFGGSRYYNGVSIVKDGRSVSFPEIGSNRYYYGNEVKFLGWIIAEESRK